MINEYFRPKTINEALDLLGIGSGYLPIGGGSTLKSMPGDFSVVDLQSLGLDTITESENQLHIGATVTLEQLLGHFQNDTSFKTAISVEASRNQREQFTVAGTICSANGRSPLLTLLSSLDLMMNWEPGDVKIPVGDWLALKRSWQNGLLITGFTLDKKAQVRFESIGRSPVDQPVICLAITTWPSKRLRIVAGGFGDCPTTILDGNLTDDVSAAIAMALSESSDEWASADYRIHSASVLASRMLADTNLFSGAKQ